VPDPLNSNSTDKQRAWNVLHKNSNEDIFYDFDIDRSLFCVLYPYLHFKIVPDSKKMVDAVVSDQAYGIVTLDEQADYFIDQYGFGKLKIGGFLAKHRPIEGVVAITKENDVLASIIQKSVDSFAPSEIHSIVQSWHMTRYHKQVDYKLIVQILGVVALILLVMYYYQRKIQRFNLELEKKVDEKTKELQKLNEQLEALVKEKVEEIVQKDRLLAIQSKQAIICRSPIFSFAVLQENLLI